MKYCVYILERRSKRTGKISYYTGMTSNFDRRLKEHKAGRTCNRGYDILRGCPIQLVPSIAKAMELENIIKKWSQQEKKEELELCLK